MTAMRFRVLVLALVICATAAPSVEAARSYNYGAGQAALQWAKKHHPKGATSVGYPCDQTGPSSSICHLTFQLGYKTCKATISVSGPNYTIRKLNATCKFR
ncbi:MAG: hypothetical protein NVS4B3_23540 [Gemmatimonadaceae bacterium]